MYFQCTLVTSTCAAYVHRASNPERMSKIAYPEGPIHLNFNFRLKNVPRLTIFENPKILHTPLRCSATASSFGPKCPLGRSSNGHFGSELSTLLHCSARVCAESWVFRFSRIQKTLFFKKDIFCRNSIIFT